MYTGALNPSSSSSSSSIAPLNQLKVFPQYENSNSHLAHLKELSTNRFIAQAKKVLCEKYNIPNNLLLLKPDNHNLPIPIIVQTKDGLLTLFGEDHAQIESNVKFEKLLDTDDFDLIAQENAAVWSFLKSSSDPKEHVEYLEKTCAPGQKSYKATDRYAKKRKTTETIIIDPSLDEAIQNIEATGATFIDLAHILHSPTQCSLALKTNGYQPIEPNQREEEYIQKNSHLKKNMENLDNLSRDVSICNSIRKLREEKQGGSVLVRLGANHIISIIPVITAWYGIHDTSKKFIDSLNTAFGASLEEIDQNYLHMKNDIASNSLIPCPLFNYHQLISNLHYVQQHCLLGIKERETISDLKSNLPIAIKNLKGNSVIYLKNIEPALLIHTYRRISIYPEHRQRKAFSSYLRKLKKIKKALLLEVDPEPTYDEETVEAKFKELFPQRCVVDPVWQQVFDIEKEYEKYRPENPNPLDRLGNQTIKSASILINNKL